MLRTISIVVLATMQVSCTKVIWVKEKGTNGPVNDVYGIPFFVKKEQFRKTTVYADTWLRATLTVEKKLVDRTTGKAVLLDWGAQQYVKDIPKALGKPLFDIKAGILRGDNARLEDAEDIINKFQRLENVDTSKPVAPVLLRNLIESEWVVDNSRTYYLNAPLPWFGIGSLTQKLAPDGTLSEAISTPDTKLAESVSALIPFKEFLTGKYVEAAPAAASTSKAKKMEIATGMRKLAHDEPHFRLTDENKDYAYVLSLGVEEVGHEYTLTTQLTDRRPALTPLQLCDIATAGAQFSRRAIGPSDTTEGKEEGSNVGITGNIKFPKDWGAPKPQAATNN